MKKREFRYDEAPSYHFFVTNELKLAGVPDDVWMSCQESSDTNARKMNGESDACTSYASCVRTSHAYGFQP